MNGLTFMGKLKYYTSLNLCGLFDINKFHISPLLNFLIKYTFVLMKVNFHITLNLFLILIIINFENGIFYNKSLRIFTGSTLFCILLFSVCFKVYFLLSSASSFLERVFFIMYSIVRVH